MKNRFFALLTCLFLLLTAAASAQNDPLREEAIAIGAVMRSLAASADYVASMGAGSGEIAQRCAELGQGDQEPSRVLCFTFDRQEAMRLIREETNSLSARLSDVELSILLDHLFGAIPSQLNAYQGVEALAAASLLTFGKAVAVPDVTECRLYVLEYAAGTPVMVSVIPGEGAVSMNGTFLMNSDWEALLAEMLPFPLQTAEMN